MNKQLSIYYKRSFK